MWQPIQGGTETHLANAMKTFPDPRARHFWDSAGWTLAAFKAPVGITVASWDLYLVYDADARWDGPEPPKPRFWMHQLWNVDNGPPLDGPELGRQVTAALARIP